MRVQGDNAHVLFAATSGEADRLDSDSRKSTRQPNTTLAFHRPGWLEYAAGSLALCVTSDVQARRQCCRRVVNCNGGKVRLSRPRGSNLARSPPVFWIVLNRSPTHELQTKIYSSVTRRPRLSLQRIGLSGRRFVLSDDWRRLSVLGILRRYRRQRWISWLGDAGLGDLAALQLKISRFVMASSGLSDSAALNWVIAPVQSPFAARTIP